MSVEKIENSLQLYSNMIAKSKDTYDKTLPAHIPSDKFIRVAQSALAANPDILNCSKNSIYLAVEQASKDGLMLDGKEAAIVIFNKNIAKKGQPDNWVKEAKYMPMMGGLLKLVRNTNMVTIPISEIIYEKDVANNKFIYHIKNGEVILEHTPDFFKDRGKPIGVYSICRLRNTNEVIAEVLTAEQVQKIRNCSKAKDSLMWKEEGFWHEGWKKSAFRRMWKRLPSSSDKENPEIERFASALQRDDDLYDFEEEKIIQTINAPNQSKQTKAAMVVAAQMPIVEEMPFEQNNNIQEDDII
jgi:recombination protein RecT